jgi:hypothetical protein
MPRVAATQPNVCADCPRCSTDLGRRPWILPDAAEPDDVVKVVARCPTGALRTHPITSTGETPVNPTEVTALPGGPILLRGDLHLIVLC